MGDRTITVCSACLLASCWQGQFYCDEYRTAGTVEKTRAELERLNLEHPSNWKDEEAMTDFDPKMIEALGMAMGVALGTPWADIPDDEKPEARRVVAAALSALPLSPEALNAIWRGEAVAVPKAITEDMAAEAECAFGTEAFWNAACAASPYAPKE